MQQIEIRASPKTRGQTFPCLTPPVTAFPMAAKTKTAQATRKGRSQTSPKTITRWLGQSPLRSLKDRIVSKSSKELVSVPRLHKP